MPVDDLFLRACRGERTERVPVWFMRQAGRSLPEYRALREKHSILDMCRTPELAAEVTLQPVRRLGVDAAILFSDIVVPLEAAGIELDISPGIGPVIEKPIRSGDDVGRIGDLAPDGIEHVNQAVRILVDELEVPLIGFGGAPFTLASYLIEGGPSKNHILTKTMMLSEPSLWAALMERLADIVLVHLRGQITAGASAIQLFDSWAGALEPADYERFVLPAVARILDGLADTGVPTILFGVGTATLLELMASAGPSVMGIDWHVPLESARVRLGTMPVQGNLDPAALMAPPEVLDPKVHAVLDAGRGRGHIFNLGHGVLPETDPDALQRVVDTVHAWQPDE
ncbi:MAG TPA: uroporphyrinogen decarboxylase [Actinomycetota bacterium]|nr:uroporphyrinogen decarboxylase [Actinomycetota bacterium]